MKLIPGLPRFARLEVSLEPFFLTILPFAAGWSSPVARQAHNLKVAGSNPAPAPKSLEPHRFHLWGFCFGPATLTPHPSGATVMFP